MTALTFRVIGIIGLLATQACSIHRLGGDRPNLLLPTKARSNGAPSRDNRGGFGLKVVQGMSPPTRLIARDGTSCVVSRKKFDSATVGKSVWCPWVDTDR